MKKKKRFICLIIIIGLIAGILSYFEPLKLAGLTDEDPYIVIAYQEFGIENGCPYINNTNYNEITENEKREITNLLKQYTYQRTFGTFFSDGSLTTPGNEAVNIYLYDKNNILTNTILITDFDDISVNGKVFKLRNSSLFIEKLLEIIDKRDGN